MEFDAARKFLIDEAQSETGILVSIRMGSDPGSELMNRLVTATKAVFEELRGEPVIDRQLAFSLYLLRTCIPEMVHSWALAGASWRPEFVDLEVARLLGAIESVFADEWIELIS